MVLPLIILQAVTFVVIVLVMRFLFGSQLKIALNRLQVLHQDSLEKEEVLNKELERAKIQVEAEISRAKEEAKQITEAAKRNSEKTSVEAIERAQAEAKRTIAETAEKTKRLEAEVLAQAEGKSIALAQELIKFVFAQKDLSILHSKLIDELIEELGKIDKSRLVVHADRAEIIVSQALTSKEKERLKEVLSLKLDTALNFDEKIDDSIIAGIVIRLGGLIIDGSLKNKFNRALSAIRSSSGIN